MAVSKAATVEDYLAALPPEQAASIARVRALVNAHLADGFVEVMAHGMIAWQVPLSTFADTYNGKPLIYAGLAAQKRHLSLYLTCVYASPERSERLRDAFARAGKRIDMGKSCLRFKRVEDLDEAAIAQEIAGFSAEDFVAFHEAARTGRS